MQIGVGLDGTLNLSFKDQTLVCQEAARLGYTSIWTPEGNGHDAFHICSLWWAATQGIVAGGLTTGIAVSPVVLRTPMALAMSAGTVTQLTGARFILGIGSGGLHTLAGRRTYGMGSLSVLGLMRDYLTSVHGLLNGEAVTQHGDSVSMQGVRLTINPPPRTPIYLGALGPEMLRLGGELADGVALNWCTPEQIRWSKDRAAEGAAKAGRDPGTIKMAEYIRVCVDDDEDIARRSFIRAMLGYALGRPGIRPNERGLGYRAHFDRMGFAEDLARLDTMRANGVSEENLIDAFPTELARKVGYYGPAKGASEAFQTLANGLDIAIVRVVAARPGIPSVVDTIMACRPPIKQHE